MPELNAKTAKAAVRDIKGWEDADVRTDSFALGAIGSIYTATAERTIPNPIPDHAATFETVTVGYYATRGYAYDALLRALTEKG